MTRPLGPYSRVVPVDGRTRQGRHLAKLRAEFTAHLGGTLSATQRVLIERAINLVLRVDLMDAKAHRDGGMTPHDARTYLAWCNSLRLIMRELGLDRTASPQAPGTALRDHIASKAA